MADVTYSRVNWEDSPSTDTPINATNLNKMDLGVSQVVARANESMPYANILDDWTDIGAVTTPNVYTADAMRVAELNTNLTAYLNALKINIKYDTSDCILTFNNQAYARITVSQDGYLAVRKAYGSNGSDLTILINGVQVATQYQSATYSGVSFFGFVKAGDIITCTGVTNWAVSIFKYALPYA